MDGATLKRRRDSSKHSQKLKWARVAVVPQGVLHSIYCLYAGSRSPTVPASVSARHCTPCESEESVQGQEEMDVESKWVVAIWSK